MSNEYNRPFYEIVCGLNNYKLGTIIESETGQRYKLTKTDNEYRKFSRIDRGLRFLTYENMNKKFRIVEEQEEIDKLEIDENGFIHTNNGSWKGRKLDIAFAESINKLAEEIKNIKEMK